MATQMTTTELRKTADGSFLRVKYGMDRIGNQEPYFSITAEEFKSAKPTSRNLISSGQMHDAIRAVFPELAHLTRWHLCSASGPMHYLANGLFWFDAHHGIGKHTRPEDKVRAPSALVSTVVLGALADDVSVETLLGMAREDVSAYLQARLPRLLEAFTAAV